MVDGISNTAAPAASPETTLGAAEYLQFLRMLESGLPKGTKAYLVSLDDAGNRRIAAVPEDCSIFNIERELLSHLEAGLPSDELLQRLRNHCTKRLKERGVELDLDLQRRLAVALECNYELDEGLAVIRKQLAEDDVPRWVGTVSRRLAELISISMAAIDDEYASIDGLEARVFDPAAPK